MAEAVVAPRSSLAGKTLGEWSFRDRYGVNVLAVWQDGNPIRSLLAKVRLKVGNGLLLQGPRERIRMLCSDPDFVVLLEHDEAPLRKKKAPFALAALLLMIGLVVTGAFPIQVAAFVGATFAVLTGALKMEEAYRAVEWRAIFLVAAVLPVGIAMERTGAANLIADGVSGMAGGWGPHAVLAALVILSSSLSQGLDGAPTVVLLAPVVLRVAEDLGISPYPLMMGVGLAASAAFMTPFSHKANLLVMGAGGYRPMDFMRVGTPLTVVVFVILTLMVPVLFPF
jgi:di/tricarboxylate transporter